MLVRHWLKSGIAELHLKLDSDREVVLGHSALFSTGWTKRDKGRDGRLLCH